jgi:hypothetical protein
MYNGDGITDKWIPLIILSISILAGFLAGFIAALAQFKTGGKTETDRAVLRDLMATVTEQESRLDRIELALKAKNSNG